MVWLYALGHVLSPLFIVNLVFAGLVVFSNRHHPGSAWAWLFVIMVLPYIGIVLYFVLGFDGRKSGIYKRKRIKDFAISTIEDTPDAIGAASDIVYLNMISAQSHLSTDNSVSLYFEGEEKFDALIRDIEAAQQSIWLEYYVFRNDPLSVRLISALTKRANTGVQVCVLVDAVGCPRIRRRQMFAQLVKAGGSVEVFASHIGGINYRNHRKLAVLDGRIGYVGGINVGEEYLGISPRFGYWRDAHIRVCGSAAYALAQRFAMDWNFVSKKKLSLPKSTSYGKGGVAMQIVCSGPDTRWPAIHHTIIKMIGTAREQILVQSPYFVPDDAVLEALRLAALSGIDVRIMIPANPDHPFVYWAALSYIGELLPAGVRCFKYQRGFLHSKTIVVDGRVATLGTANMDLRSFKLNFEINAVIYDEAVCELLTAQFIRDMRDSKEILPETYALRSNWDKTRESISRLLSPIL